MHRPIKVLYVGASGTGKTGSLTSLVKAGYELRVLDLDNGMDALLYHTEAECPDRLSSIDYETIRDKWGFGPTGPKVKGAPTALPTLFKRLDTWQDGTTPAEWGSDKILVVDSLTAVGQAAYAWARATNPTTKEKRQWYQAGQEAIEALMAGITSADFNTNVIVCTHLDIREEDGLNKAFASSLGRALGPKLPRFFNTMILAESSGTGSKVRRKIKTFPTSLIDLKTPAPMEIDAEYPLETGMASIFSKLKREIKE